MVMKIGQAQSTHCFEQGDLNKKEESLKRISLPQGESLEHFGFYNQLDNKVCSPADIYNVSFQKTAAKIKDFQPKQLTAGDGVGGG